MRRLPADPSRHALIAPRIAQVFQELDLSVSLWEPGRPHNWHVIYNRVQESDLVSHELQHAAEAERVEYNNRSLRRALRTRTAVLAHHSGFADLFVPVRWSGPLRSVLVTGPFSTQRPTATDLLERWRALTGRQAHPSDPQFSGYLAMTLSVLLLEGGRVARLQKLVECFARLITGNGDADALYGQVGALRNELVEARFVDRMWDITRSMMDERTSRIWASPNMSRVLSEVGITRLPEHALAGFFVDREPSEPVQDALRRDALQRACAGIARRIGNVACGRAGANGVVLVGGRGSSSSARRLLLGLTESVSTLARRRFGFSLHFGMSTLTIPLSEQVQAALAAAESAVSQGVRIVYARESTRTESPLAVLSRELGAHVEEKPELLPARFDRYVEVVGARCGFRLEPARAYLEAGFARITDGLGDSGVFDARGLTGLCEDVQRSAENATTAGELFAVYRRAVAEIADAHARPRALYADRSLRRAEQHMRRHFGERLGLARIARIAGFSATYFSELFRKKQGVTFEQHLLGIRIERAKQLLGGTSLSLQRVAALCGLSTRNYLGRVFKRVTGETPMGYRRRVLDGLAQPKKVRQLS